MTTTQHTLGTATAPTNAAQARAGDSLPTGSPELDVLVIGGGQAGLSMAWHLAQRGARYLVVDEAPTLGHSWRSRWDSLRLFSPAQYDSLPGMAFPAAHDTYPSKDDVADYLAAYADKHELAVQTDTRVLRLTAPGDGDGAPSDGFVAHTTRGVLRARQVVIATGATHHPYVPTLSTGFDAAVTQLHTKAYRNPGSVPAGRVLVVGAGNSGLQVADELAATRDVILATGTQPLAVPQRFAGRDLFWWMSKLGLMNVTAGSRLARKIRGRGDFAVGTDRKAMARHGVDFRARLTSAEGRTAVFEDGTQAEVDAVVWATGFRPDYAWVEAALVGPDGHLQHEGGASQVNGLWFVGLPWQRTRGSSLLGFVHRDAADLAVRMLTRQTSAT
jgi:putative flavoprotein involved in K+ transport